jgi:4-amino-4-deoxy-L-arabinose transferase-like glycosyltransferase
MVVKDELRLGGALGRAEALPRPSAPATAAIATCLAFIAISCWWLSADSAIPIYDAGYHLHTALLYRQMVVSGNLLGPFEEAIQYPPLPFLIGVLGMLIGGVGVAPAIIALDIIFVPLLALGCYQSAKLLFSPLAGALAVLVALSSPLAISELHTFMLDAPEAALVACAIWLILAGANFASLATTVAAGVVVGLGLMVKVTFPLFLAGIVIAELLRGGWRHWRSLLAGAAAMALIAFPWYIYHFSEFATFVRLAGAESGAVPGNLPPFFSSANWLWYFWSTLNSQLLAVPFALFVLGSVLTALSLRRSGPQRALRAELLAGLVVAWLAVTLTPHKDVRYDLPYLPYLAILAAGAVVQLPGRRARAAGAVVLAGAALASTLGAGFGVGSFVQLDLVAHPPETEAAPDRIVLYAPTAGLGVGGPQRDGDVPGLMRALRSAGVRVLSWNPQQARAPDFSSEGLIPLALIAGLHFARDPLVVQSGPQAAELIHEPPGAGRPAPCTVLADGSAVWVLRIDPASGHLALFCPYPNPHYYT